MCVDDLQKLADELTRRLGPDVQQSAVDSEQNKLLVFAQPDHGGEVRQTLESLGAEASSYELHEGEFRALERQAEHRVLEGPALAALAPSNIVGGGVTIIATPGTRILPAEGNGGILSCLVTAASGTHGLTVEHLFRRRNGEGVRNGAGVLGSHLRNGGLAAAGTASADCALVALAPGVSPRLGLFPPHVRANHLALAENRTVRRQDRPTQTARAVGVTFEAHYSIDILQTINGAETVVPKKVVLPNQVLLRDPSRNFAIDSDSGLLVLLTAGGPTGTFVAGAPLAILTSRFDDGRHYTASPIATCLALLNLTGIA